MQESIDQLEKDREAATDDMVCSGTINSAPTTAVATVAATPAPLLLLSLLCSALLLLIIIIIYIQFQHWLQCVASRCGSTFLSLRVKS